MSILKLILVCALFVSGIGLLKFYFRSKKGFDMQGKIILLNGASSSGKSAILNELQNINANCKVFKVDDYFPSELSKKAQEYGWEKSSGIDPWLFLNDYMNRKTGEYYFGTELRQKLFNNIPKYYSIMKDEALKGQNCILDTVLEYEQEYQRFDDFFRDSKTVKILVYCPLDILLQRVQKRNLSGKPEEMRTVFQSFEQFPAIYKVQEHSCEQVVDTVKTSAIKDALDMAIQEFVKNNIPQPYLPKLEEFKREFIKLYKLEEQEEIVLVAKHSYDLVLNSGTQSPDELAEQINMLL